MYLQAPATLTGDKPVLRGRANREMTSDGRQLSGLSNRLRSTRRYICYSPIGASSKKPTLKHRGHGVRQISDDVVPVTAPIYFLPESKLSEREKLEFVLRDLCGVEVSAPEPVWISEFVTPGQEEVDRELA